MIRTDGNVAKRYISDGGWFDAGTEAFLIDDYRPDWNSGLFLGLKDGWRDEEICSFGEFIILGHHSE